MLPWKLMATGGNTPEGFMLLTYIYLVAHLHARLGGFGAIFWQEMQPKRERVWAQTNREKVLKIKFLQPIYFSGSILLI